ncbi:ribonuclease H-like domain-containing protein [Dipodascopsis tothii]|uniref:ribonuclease H-like domain-containing protein n=1 Tax=Dipodascopsis tothii TaxID=44089 RepID=UPI0034CFADCA
MVSDGASEPAAAVSAETAGTEPNDAGQTNTDAAAPGTTATVALATAENAQVETATGEATDAAVPVYDAAGSADLPDALAALSLSSAVRELRTPVRYVLCMDIEATFENRARFLSNTHEVIELAVVLVDLHTGARDEFHTYVRPTRASLTPLCTELTGISPAELRAAPSFKQAMTALAEFLDRHPEAVRGSRADRSPSATCMWVTDGSADIDRFLAARSCKVNNYRLPAFFEGAYIDLKQLFRACKKERVHRTLTDMLGYWRLPFSGRQHNGLDDARAVAQIVELLIDDGHLLRPNRAIYLGRKLDFTARVI